MSYCRFSSEDFASDVYCYEHFAGYFAIHVAGNRLMPGEPLPPRVQWTGDNAAAVREREDAVMRILEASPRVAIGLAHDGESLQEPDAGACADRLEYLRGLGYVVPQFAIDTLREEAAEGQGA